MLLILQIFTILINIYFLYIIIRRKGNANIFFIVLILFQIIFVTPILLEILLGTPNIRPKSPAFQFAIDDPITNIFYNLFTIVIPFILLSIGRMSNQDFGLDEIKKIIEKKKINKNILMFFSILMFLPIIAALLSPQPAKYFTEYAYFQRFPKLSSLEEITYHTNIMNISGIISLISILIVRLFNSPTSKRTSFIVYTAAITTGILNGKRTLFAFIIILILLIDLLKSKNRLKAYFKLAIGGILIIILFIAYSYFIGKHTRGVSTLDNIRLYFFRDIDVKFSIYARLNPLKYKILNYSGQSYLYNLFFFIPRKIWVMKPYPYDIYVTTSALGLGNNLFFDWSFQTSSFGEAISNFGIIGFFTLTLLYCYFIKISIKSKNSLIIILSLFIIFRSFMNHFGTYKYFVILWLILQVLGASNIHFFLKKKFKSRRKKT